MPASPGPNGSEEELHLFYGHRKLINLSDLAASLGESYCETLLGFYVFTGEDCTSSFKGKGKVAPLKKLEKNPRFHKCFQQLGDDWNVNADVLKEVEKFTCLMYEVLVSSFFVKC